MSIRRLALGLAPLVGLSAALGGFDWWRSHDVGPVQRGARLAAARG